MQIGQSPTGKPRAVAVDETGRVITTSTAAAPASMPSTYMSAAREKSATIKATGGVLYEVIAANLNSGGTRYLMLFDKATGTAINGGDLPLMPPIKLDAGETKGFVFRLEAPLSFTNGIKAALSTSDASYAAPGGDEGHFYARYV